MVRADGAAATAASVPADVNVGFGFGVDVGVDVDTLLSPQALKNMAPTLAKRMLRKVMQVSPIVLCQTIAREFLITNVHILFLPMI